MSFVLNDPDCPIVWFFENSDCRDCNRIDNCRRDIVLSKLDYSGKEFLY